MVKAGVVHSTFLMGIKYDEMVDLVEVRQKNTPGGEGLGGGCSLYLLGI